MKWRYSLVFQVVAAFLAENSSFAETSRAGGQWHQEALDAWKDFNKGRNLSEEELDHFLRHGKNEDLNRYYATACNKGSANFCFFAGWDHAKHSKTMAAHFYQKGCDIAHDSNNCMAAVSTYLDTNQMKQAIETFKKACSTNDPDCDFAGESFPGYKKFRNMLSLTCADGHALSCSILTRYGIKHKTPSSVATEEKRLWTSSQEDEQIERRWDGQYDKANCSSIDECNDAGDRLSKTGKYQVESIPFRAKACTLGGGSACLVVGSYEEDFRKDVRSAHYWYKRGCDNTPTAKGLCLTVVETDLKMNNVAEATVLFEKVCSTDVEGYCEATVLGEDDCNGKCNRPKSLANQYLEMLTHACKDGHEVSCNILPKYQAKQKRKG